MHVYYEILVMKTFYKFTLQGIIMYIKYGKYPMALC